jgi:hypothetical protein
MCKPTIQLSPSGELACKRKRRQEQQQQKEQQQQQQQEQRHYRSHSHHQRHSKSSHSRRRRRRHVRFAETTEIHTVSNIANDNEYKDQLWYSNEEIGRIEKRDRRLVKRLHFYSNEQLFDKFGLTSKKEVRQRRKHNQVVQLCMYLMLSEGVAWKDDGGNNSSAVTMYSAESMLCAEAARERATMVTRQLINDEERRGKFNYHGSFSSLLQV